MNETKQPTNFRSLGIWLFVGVALGVAVLVFGPFRKRTPDYAAAYDRQIEEQWLVSFQKVDAIDYLEKGGLYNYDPEFSEANYDKSFFLPMLIRLNGEEKLNFTGLISPKLPNELYGVIAELPGEPAARERIRTIIRDEESRFKGAVQDRFGHRWLDLDYFEPDDDGFADYVKEKVN